MTAAARCPFSSTRDASPIVDICVKGGGCQWVGVRHTDGYIQAHISIRTTITQCTRNAPFSFGKSSTLWAGVVIIWARPSMTPMDTQLFPLPAT